MRSQARRIQWRNPPSSQMNITASLPSSFALCLSSSSSCLHRRFFPLLSSPPTLPSPRCLHYSPPLLRDPGTLGSSCRRCSRLHVRQSSRGCCTILPVCLSGPAPLLGPFSSAPSHGDSEQAPLSRREGERAVVQPPSRLLTRGTLEETRKRRGFFFLSFVALEESCSPAASICAPFFLKTKNSRPPRFPPSLGLQFWLCVGTRKRGPKCLKPITCSQCRGVTSRCVTLLFVLAALDQALWFLAFHFFFQGFHSVQSVFIEAVSRHADESLQKKKKKRETETDPLVSQRGRSDRMVFCCSGSILRAAEPCVCLRACLCCCVGAVHARSLVRHKQLLLLLQCLGLRAPTNTF